MAQASPEGNTVVVTPDEIVERIDALTEARAWPWMKQGHVVAVADEDGRTYWADGLTGEEVPPPKASAGLGVAFEPDGEGWRVSYILHGWPAYEDYSLPGGELANAYDLEVGAKAALKPLVELGERAARYFAEREARG